MRAEPEHWWLKNSGRLILALLLATSILQLQATQAGAASGSCFLIGQTVGDAISTTDLADTNPATNETTIGLTGVNSLRVGAIRPSTGVLYSTSPSRLGTVNTSSGIFEGVGNPYGSLSGALGNQNLNDVRGLAFDPTDGTLYSVSRRAGGADLLFTVDPTTGTALPDAFGPGVGYVELVSSDPAQDDFHGLAFATTGDMVGMGRDSGDLWKLHAIDKTSGAAVAGADSPALTDLSYDADGNLWGITTGGTLFNLNGSETTRTVDNFTSYSALACGTGAGNQAPVFDQDVLGRSDWEGDVVSVSVGASDADGGDVLTYSAVNLPPGLSIDAGSGLISGTLSYVAAGSYAVTVTVTDDGVPVASATDSFTWTVGEADPPVTNQNPVAVADTFTIVDDAGEVVISVLSNDFDPDSGDVVRMESYDASNVTRGTLVHLGDGLFTYWPEPGSGYTDSFTYTVIDLYGGVASATVTIVVAYVAPNPTVEIAPPDPDPQPAVDPALDPDPLEAALPEIPASITAANDVVAPAVPGGLASAERREVLLSQLAEFGAVPALDASSRAPLQRTLVILARVGMDTVQALGMPFVLLAAAGLLIAYFGRVSLFPLLKRTRRVSGVVVWIDDGSEFGFILPDGDQAKVFFHQDAVAKGEQVATPGQSVSFRLARGRRRDFALGVRSIPAS